MKHKIIFRADGNNTTGLGHLYRLFALVEMLKNEYEYVYLSQESSTLEVIPKEYNLKTINTSLKNEPIWISKNFDPKEYIIIADGYQFNSEYQKAIKEYGFKLIYIDDLESYHIYADILINHSSAAKKENFKHEKYTRFALGTNYALLRPSFLATAKKQRNIKDLNTAFVCFGGADKYDLSIKTTKALLKIDQIKKINIVLGAAYKKNEIIELEKKNKQKINIYRNLSESKLHDLMLSCNFAIAPTSTILYELCCIKMPIISGFFVDNQISVYKWFKKAKCFLGIDDFTKFDFEKLEIYFKNLNEKSLIEQQIKQQSLSIDGLQKERFLKLVASLKTD